MILVDTSVWIQHFRHGDRILVQYLSEELVLMHPFIYGELACGNFKSRAAIFSDLNALAQSKLASHGEALRLLEDRRLWGRGLGWIDVHLLASALLSHCRFLTLDKRLREAATELGLT